MNLRCSSFFNLHAQLECFWPGYETFSRVSKSGYETFWTVTCGSTNIFENFMKLGVMKHFEYFCFSMVVWNFYFYFFKWVVLSWITKMWFPKVLNFVLEEQNVSFLYRFHCQLSLSVECRRVHGLWILYVYSRAGRKFFDHFTRAI